MGILISPGKGCYIDALPAYLFNKRLNGGQGDDHPHWISLRQHAAGRQEEADRESKYISAENHEDLP